MCFVCDMVDPTVSLIRYLPRLSTLTKEIDALGLDPVDDSGETSVMKQSEKSSSG